MLLKGPMEALLLLLTAGRGSSPLCALRLQGCLVKLKNLFEENFLTTGISVIVLCIVEVK